MAGRAFRRVVVPPDVSLDLPKWLTHLAAGKLCPHIREGLSHSFLAATILWRCKYWWWLVQCSNGATALAKPGDKWKHPRTGRVRNMWEDILVDGHGLLWFVAAANPDTGVR